MKRPNFIFLLAFIVASCIPDPVEIDIPQPDPKLVVASQMLFDQGVLVQVSRSFGALEFSEEESDTLSNDLLDRLLADSARVVMSHAGEQDTLFNLSSGLYLGLGVDLVEGESYVLSVFDSATAEMVTAETVVLPQVFWGDVSYSFEQDSFTLSDTTFLDTALELDISFEDLPGVNYYMVNLYRISQPDSQGQGADLSGLFALNDQGDGNTYPLSDQLYSSQTIRDTLRNSNFRPGDTLSLTLSHISPQYYQYLTTRERSSGSLFANLLGEPVNFPTNVEGGYGIFNLHLTSVQTIVLN